MCLSICPLLVFNAMLLFNVTESLVLAFYNYRLDHLGHDNGVFASWVFLILYLQFLSISNIPTHLVTIRHIYITLSLYRKRFVKSVVGFRSV